MNKQKKSQITLSHQCEGITKSNVRCRCRVLRSQNGRYLCYHHTQNEHFQYNTKVAPDNILSPPKDSYVCVCCMDDIKFEETINCQIPDHALCKPCFIEYIRGLVQDDAKTEFKCGGHPDCKNMYTLHLLKSHLPLHIWNYVDEMLLKQTMDTVQLFVCPLCKQYKEIIEGIEFLKKEKHQFHCLQCDKFICMNCNSQHLFGKQCIYTKESIQKQIEEILSDCRVRKCPKCNIEFVRIDGCCKMKCTRCGTLSCYNCRQQISGYNHFGVGDKKTCALFKPEKDIECDAIKEAKDIVWKTIPITESTLHIFQEITNSVKKKITNQETNDGTCCKCIIL
jgi:hypothetical protein